MRNKKGFTLIELLAVIVILGVIMTIAIPNIVSTLDKNKKEAFLEDAKSMATSAEYKIKSDTSLEYPNVNSIVVIKLKNLDSINLELSPYDTYYSLEKSFVAITKESIAGSSDFEYVYYVHLVSCTDKECKNQAANSVAYNRGLNLSRVDKLNTNERFDLVVKGAEVERDLIANVNSIKSKLGKDYVNIYEK